MRTNGGYVILDLQDANVYAQAQNCLLVNKPVMVYDNSQVYYADTIILDGTNIVLTKGGKTITIANDNTITTSGDIQEKLHLYQINIYGEVGGDTIDFYMNIYSNKELKTGNLSADDTDTINELNLYQETFMRDSNNYIKTIATYENLYVDNDALEFNFYNDEGETSFATGTTQLKIAKVF